MFDDRKDGINCKVSCIKCPKFFSERFCYHCQGPKNTKFTQSLDARKVTMAQEGSRSQVKLMVTVRCRPLLKHELKANLYEIVRIMDKKVFNIITFPSLLFFLILWTLKELKIL